MLQEQSLSWTSNQKWSGAYNTAKKIHKNSSIKGERQLLLWLVLLPVSI